jgi:hypothetical protein
MKIGKKSKILITLLILIALLASSFALDFSKEDIKYGITFSSVYARDELHLNWQETYTAILDDLKVDNIRLSAYWNQIENERDIYNFDDLDWQIEEASKRNVNITLAVGRRLPRWPECHDPLWISHLSKEEIRTEQLELVGLVVNRYKDNPNIKTWQVENEPFLRAFGICPSLDKEALNQEIKLVRDLTDTPILVTDTGELNLWISAARTGADTIGSTLYRVVYNENIGYTKYPIPAWFYYAKATMIKTLFGTRNVINSELQAEAWHTEEKDLTQMSLEDQFKSMDLEQLEKNISFSQKAGFDEIYLWGAEWWYFLKVNRDYPHLWEEAKNLWQ